MLHQRETKRCILKCTHMAALLCFVCQDQQQGLRFNLNIISNTTCPKQMGPLPIFILDNQQQKLWLNNNVVFTLHQQDINLYVSQDHRRNQFGREGRICIKRQTKLPGVNLVQLNSITLFHLSLNKRQKQRNLLILFFAVLWPISLFFSYHYFLKQ